MRRGARPTTGANQLLACISSCAVAGPHAVIGGNNSASGDRPPASMSLVMPADTSMSIG
jgi:hypothetical protein